MCGIPCACGDMAETTFAHEESVACTEPPGDETDCTLMSYLSIGDETDEENEAYTPLVLYHAVGFECTEWVSKITCEESEECSVESCK